MSKIKPYKEEEPLHQQVGESMMPVYQSPVSMDDFINSIPRDALTDALRFALEESRAGRCIPNSQIEELVNERMGWR